MAAPAAQEAEAAPVRHVRFRGAFGVAFFWHHAVVVGVAPAAGAADERLVFHWSGGTAGGGADGAPVRDKLATLEAAEICAVPWAQFQASADACEHASGVIETVVYSADVMAENPPAVQAARARALVGHRGLLSGVDAAGNEVPGYNPLTWNCEHYAVFVMTGTARSLQVDTAKAIAGVVGNVVSSLAGGDSGARGASFHVRSSGSDLQQLVLVAGLSLGVMALTSSSAHAVDGGGDADEDSRARKPETAAPDRSTSPPAVAQRPRVARMPHTQLLPPPAAHGAWTTPLLRTLRACKFEPLPLAALTAAVGLALNVEVLRADGSPHAPQRRWLCAAERHDVLPFSLCFGHRLHAEALVDDAAASFLALPSFQFWFEPRAGGCPPCGLRGVLYAAPVGCAAASPALFGLDHLRRSKFMCAGTCAAFPGTDVDEIFHLGLSPVAGGVAATLTLADYTTSASQLPVDDGFALRWVEPGEAAHAHRAWPYFACTPEGFRRDTPVGCPGATYFRFWLRAPAAAAADAADAARADEQAG
jgi:hypothetical protein